MKVNRVWNGDRVRLACIANDWCTRMTNEEYIPMLDGIDGTEPTYENIRTVAEVIVDGSDLDRYGQTRMENIASVMFVLEADTVSTFFELEDEE